MSEEQVKTIGGKTFISLHLILALLGGGGGSYLVSSLGTSDTASAISYTKLEEIERDRLEQERKNSERFTEILVRIKALETKVEMNRTKAE